MLGVKGIARLTVTGLTVAFMIGCGSETAPKTQEQLETSVITNPVWLSDARVQMNFADESFDLGWDAYGYYTHSEAESALNFAHGPTATHDSDLAVQWNLSWVSGLDGAGYASPYILYRVEGLTAGKTYYPTAMVEVESNRSLEEFDGGIGPEFVVGAFSSMPQKVEEQGTGLYVLEVEERTLSRSADTATLGTVDIPEEFLEGNEHVTKRIVNDSDSVYAVANAEGELWILLAVYSGHAGQNDVHVKRIAFDW
jgi:hypothetical protein